MKRCPNCGSSVDDDAKFCIYCGKNLEEDTKSDESEIYCVNCGRKLSKTEKFCPVCGHENEKYDPNAAYSENVNENTNNGYGYSENTNENVNPEPVKAGEAYKRFFKNYVNFKGTSSRAEYWWPVLFNNIIETILSYITIPFLTYSYSFDFSEYGVGLGVETWTINILVYIFELLIFLPGLACAVRRLRDAGKNPWCYLCIFIPFAGPFMLLVWLIAPTGKYGRYSK